MNEQRKRLAEAIAAKTDAERRVADASEAHCRALRLLAEADTALAAIGQKARAAADSDAEAIAERLRKGERVDLLHQEDSDLRERRLDAERRRSVAHLAEQALARDLERANEALQATNATLEAAMRAAMEGERDRVAAELAEVQKTERRLRYLLVALGDAHMPPGRPIWLTNEQGRLLDPHNDLFIPLGGEHHPTNIAAKECAAFVTALRHDADAQLA
ncbi:hypothetical protein TK49_13240 [Ralstonia mannitolilytica]|uniref:hypothetical protein n=1 Tax=Ralstonia mannitolilytica TaxID=105219 RepID=UPI0005D73F17|nr:hypothetical protein [Ralstonia mannitolilytica]AJW45578.1 hypothetical protein TK49_13240 [Ralstonia mannitolilytica]